MNEQFIMRPAETFVADECGCSFTVESGPSDESMAMQAPRCCCGHEMHKQGSMQQSGEKGQHGAGSGMSQTQQEMSTPQMMRD